MLNGAVFHPNGWNKVYNDQDEIWIDGKFKNAQLWDGKEFIYDTDGVLMKVKVFKNGEFFSNGML
jgi:antitoxin component YwqK of YwqJK toxin-antitoxin module